MNQGNPLNGQELLGPSVILRGLTNSQINEGHAFSFYLSVKLKRSYIKGQTQEVPMVCQLIGDGVDESKDEPNMVEYFCNGYLTSGEIYQLKEYAGDDIGEIGIAKLKEDSVKNLGIIMSTNLNDMSFANIKEEKQQFSLKKFLNTIQFTPEKIENLTSNNYYFDFTLKGKINEEVNKINLDFNLPLVEVEISATCNLNIEGDKLADLNCKINLEEYKNYSIFSFKLVDIEDGERTIILSQINEIYLKTGNDIDANNSENSENNGKKGLQTLPIIIIAACGGGAVIGIGITVFVCIRKQKPREMINICNQNMPNQGINPVKIENKIIKNKIKKLGNKGKKIDKKNNGKKFKKTKENKKTDGDVIENESSRRKIVPFNNKNK